MKTGKKSFWKTQLTDLGSTVRLRAWSWLKWVGQAYLSVVFKSSVLFMSAASPRGIPGMQKGNFRILWWRDLETYLFSTETPKWHGFSNCLHIEVFSLSAFPWRQHPPAVLRMDTWNLRIFLGNKVCYVHRTFPLRPKWVWRKLSSILLLPRENSNMLHFFIRAL